MKVQNKRMKWYAAHEVALLVVFVLFSHLVSVEAQTEYKIKELVPNPITTDTDYKVKVWIERPAVEPVPPVVMFYLEGQAISAEKYASDLYELHLPKLVTGNHAMALMVNGAVVDTRFIEAVPAPDTVEKVIWQVEHQIQQYKQFLIAYAQFYTQTAIQRVKTTLNWLSLQEVLKEVTQDYKDLWYMAQDNLNDSEWEGVDYLEKFTQMGIISEETETSLWLILVDVITNSQREIQDVYLGCLHEFINKGLQEINPLTIYWGVYKFEQILKQFEVLLESWFDAISYMAYHESSLTQEHYAVANSIDELNKMYQEGIKNLEILHQHISEISKIFVKLVGYAFESSGFNENQYKEKVNAIVGKQNKEFRSDIAGRQYHMEIERYHYQTYSPVFQAPQDKKWQARIPTECVAVFLVFIYNEKATDEAIRSSANAREKEIKRKEKVSELIKLEVTKDKDLLKTLKEAKEKAHEKIKKYEEQKKMRAHVCRLETFGHGYKGRLVLPSPIQVNESETNAVGGSMEGVPGKKLEIWAEVFAYIQEITCRHSKISFHHCDSGVEGGIAEQVAGFSDKVTKGYPGGVEFPQKGRPPEPKKGTKVKEYKPGEAKPSIKKIPTKIRQFFEKALKKAKKQIREEQKEKK